MTENVTLNFGKFEFDVHAAEAGRHAGAVDPGDLEHPGQRRTARR